LLAIGVAAVQTVVSLCSQIWHCKQWGWRYEVLFWDARPIFRYLLAGTFIWWLALALAAAWLWTRRHRLADMLPLAPLVLASGVMYVFYNTACFQMYDVTVKGFPLRMVCPGDCFGRRSWDLWVVAGNFAFWLAVFALVLYLPKIIRAVRR
jgi:hypothetical protein